MSPHPDYNVVGVGIGPKKKNGRHTGTMAVRLYVRHKFDLSLLTRKHRLPPSINGMPVDVIEVGHPRLLSGISGKTIDRVRPVQPGHCITAAGPTEAWEEIQGTLGAILEDAAGSLYLLSCNHVLANQDYYRVGTRIFQPNGAKPSDQIGTLRTAVPLNRKGGEDVDCAIATVISDSAVSAVPCDPVGPLSSSQSIDAAQNMNVEKYGATTSHTTGTITDIDAHFQVPYEYGETILLEHQIYIEDAQGPFADSGDSGSLVVDQSTKEAVGLLAYRMTGACLANRMSSVMAQLSTKLGSTLKLRISP